MLGRGLSSKTAKKKLEKAQEDVQKGEHKDLDKLEKGVKWVRNYKSQVSLQEKSDERKEFAANMMSTAHC